MELPGAGGEDPVAVPAGRDEHRRRPRGGRGWRRGGRRVDNGHPEELRVVVGVGVRVGGVVEVEERVGEGEGDEAGGLDVLQLVQLRAHRHWTHPIRLPPASSREGFAAARQVWETATATNVEPSQTVWVSSLNTLRDQQQQATEK